MEQEIKQIEEGKTTTAGGSFKAFCVFREIIKRQDKNGRTYYDATACDSTGNMDAKIWSDALWLDKSGFAKTEDEHIPEDDIPEIVGKTIGINVRVTEYRGAPQYSITKVTLLNQDQFPPSVYVEHSPIPQETLEARFENLLSTYILYKIKIFLISILKFPIFIYTYTYTYGCAIIGKI